MTVMSCDKVRITPGILPCVTGTYTRRVLSSHPKVIIRAGSTKPLVQCYQHG